MNKSHAKSAWDNTAILYLQTAPTSHDMCLGQESFRCKIAKIIAIFNL